MSHCQQTSPDQSLESSLEPSPVSDFESRQQAAENIRDQIRSDAASAFSTSLPLTNGDQEQFEDLELPGFASFTKALKHNSLGLVDSQSYDSLLSAIQAGTQEAFECVRLGGGARLLANPLNAYSHQLIGDDSNGARMAPAPKFDSRNMAVDMVEHYWMALCRDVRFDRYAHNELITAACEDLNSLGFEQEFGFSCTPATIFRGAYEGCTVGPHVSQFLIQDFLFGNQLIRQRQRYPRAGLDYLTDLSTWKKVNNGDINPTGSDIIDGTRYMMSLRDAGQWVHLDYPHQSSLWSTIMLLEKIVKPSAAIPYVGDRITTSDAFGSLGGPDITIHAGLAGVYGLKHAWFQKWCVHLRLRPEAYAQRLELFRRGDLRGGISNSPDVPFNSDRFIQMFGEGASVWRKTQVLDRIFEHNRKQNREQNRGDRDGSWLLPIAFPEGSPTHPAYPGGHSVFVAAAATVAKAFFANDKFPNPKVPVDDGQYLDDWKGDTLTIHGELNKLIANVTLFRDGAGMHWRTDGMAVGPEASTGRPALELETGGNLLGEKLAVSMLRDIRPTYRESVGRFEFQGIEGNLIYI